jgi:hypothetical protein
LDKHKQRHITYGCDKCNRVFKRQAARDTHVLTCGDEVTCVHCRKSFSSKAILKRHEKSFDHLLRAPVEPKVDSTPPRSVTPEVDSAPLQFPEDPMEPPDDDLPEINEVIRQYWEYIRTHVQKWRVVEIYNIRLHANMNMVEALKLIDRIHRNHPYKINMEPGILLYNNIANRYR